MNENEKRTGKKIVLYVFLLLVVLGIGVLIGFALSNYYNPITILDIESNIEQQNTIEKDNTTEATNSNGSNESIATNEDEYGKAIIAIKNCLKDNDWLKENIYVKESEKIGDEDITDQIINFIVCKGEKVPVVILYVASENVRFHKIILVSYVNGSVKSEIINQGHYYHGGYSVDPNNNIVVSGFMHMGYDSTAVHKIVKGEITVLGAYGTEEVYDGENISYKYTIDDGTGINLNKEVTKEEYEEYKSNINVEQYNIVEVGTPLSNENVDLYVK